MKRRTKNEFKIYISALLYIIIFNIIVVSSVIALHELGHFYIGQYLGCENIKIVLLDESLKTYTQMNCSPDMPMPSIYALMLAGFLFVIPISIALIFMRNYEKFYSVIAIGFNFLISSSDLSVFPAAFSYIFPVLGVIFILYGETLLINNYLMHIDKLRVVMISSSKK